MANDTSSTKILTDAIKAAGGDDLLSLFFMGMSDEHKKLWESRIHHRNYEASTVILREGETNEKLFLLLSGSVDVLRRGEKILSLDTIGDLLGEMSLLTRAPCTATLLCSEASILLEIDFSNPEDLPDELRKGLNQRLDRFFALVLVQRLERTSEKARLFEMTARELEGVQKALVEATQSKINELSIRERQQASKLSKVWKEEFPELESLLMRLQSKIDFAEASPERSELKSLASNLGMHLSSLKQVVEPLVAGLRDDSLQKYRVLIAETDPQEQVHAKVALGGTGVTFDVISSIEEGASKLKEFNYDLVCASESLEPVLDAAFEKDQLTKIVFMTSQPIENHLAHLIEKDVLANLLVRHPDDRVFNVKSTATTVRKLLSNDLFGMEKYLLWGTEIHELQVIKSEDRVTVIEQVKSAFSSLDVKRALLSKVARATEEILMNAIYDAPLDSNTGKPLYNHLERTVPVELIPSHAAKLRYACDGVVLAVSVEDPFGRIKRSTVLKTLEKVMVGKIGDEKFAQDAQLEKSGGGGNGLFQIIKSSSLTIFNVEPGRRTEVIVLFNMSMQFEKKTSQPSFHFFTALKK